MIFSFLKYLQPINYFQLVNNSGVSIFPEIKTLPKDILNQLKRDEQYESDDATDYDLSWQAVQLGYIGTSPTYRSINKVSVADNYRFLRKNFHSAWVFYVLILRLGSFKMPSTEISCYLKTRKVKQYKLKDNAIKYPKYPIFQSTLVYEEEPLVSVIIPTLNRYPYLKDVLNDLERQDYRNFEVLVIDQSVPFNEEFYTEFNLNLKLTHQQTKALWLARNSAIKQAKGDFILLFDDDSRVESDWIRQHLKCLDYFKAELSSGVSISQEGARVPENYSFFRVSDQLDTGNVLVKKQVFKAIGLFDRQFEKQRMGDGEFGLRSHLHGFLNVSNPYAQRLHLKAGDGGLREMGSWDALRPKKLFSPRPIPSVLYFYRRYFGNKSCRLELMRTIPSSIMPYRFKKSRYMMLFGATMSIFISPLILFQIIKSWRISNEKLKKGPQIDVLT